MNNDNVRYISRLIRWKSDQKTCKRLCSSRAIYFSSFHVRSESFMLLPKQRNEKMVFRIYKKKKNW